MIKGFFHRYLLSSQDICDVVSVRINTIQIGLIIHTRWRHIKNKLRAKGRKFLFGNDCLSKIAVGIRKTSKQTVSGPQYYMQYTYIFVTEFNRNLSESSDTGVLWESNVCACSCYNCNYFIFISVYF